MKKRFIPVLALSSVLLLGSFASIVSCQETTKKDVAVTGVSIELSAATVEIGGTVTATVVVTPNDATNAKYTITSSDTNIATVSGNTITGVAAGDVIITVKTEDGQKTANKNLTVNAKKIASIALNKESFDLTEIGNKEILSVTLTNVTGVPTWETTDDQNIAITPSTDGLTCEVLNVKGGTSAVITVTLGSLSKDCTVRASSYGDLRKSYTIHKNSTEAAETPVKGLWNAIGVLNSDDNYKNTGYITEKDSEEVLYKRTGAWASLIGKTKASDELDGTSSWSDSKTSWYSNYQLNSDVTKVGNTVFTGENEDGSKSTAYNVIDARPTNWDKSIFLDGYDGYSGAGNPGTAIWGGWRSSYYRPSTTGAQYVTWADPYQWSGMDMNWDLSKSTLTPSYNKDQGVFAQIYLGSSYRIPFLCGVYFDGGTIDGNAQLEDGAEKDIFTFSETLSQKGQLTSAGWGSDRTIGTTSIGKAKWDAFNKCWSFPNVKVNLNVDISFTGENLEAPTANYTRSYKISGYKGETKVATVDYQKTYADYSTETSLARAAANERSMYGVTFTPNYGANILPDITCGAKWTNVIQGDSTSVQMAGATDAANDLQFVAGRTVNKGNQTCLYGADSLTLTHDADNHSIFNFEY